MREGGREGGRGGEEGEVGRGRGRDSKRKVNVRISQKQTIRPRVLLYHIAIPLSPSLSLAKPMPQSPITLLLMN